MGRSWCFSCGVETFRALLGSIFGSPWGPKRPPRRPQDDTVRLQDGPKRCQDEAQDDQKSNTKSSSKTIASWNDLKTVLVRSCADLGPLPRSFLMIVYCFLYYFVEISVFQKKCSQDVSWDDLGPIWSPKRLQDGGLLVPKLGSGALKISS